MQEFWWPAGPPPDLKSTRPYEADWLKRHGLRFRRELHFYFLSGAGLEELAQLLHSGCYRIGSPEEGALLSVVWLAELGRLDDMEQVLDAIGPAFSTLRLFPEPFGQPYELGERLWLKPLRVVQRRLTAVPMAPQRAAEENRDVWTRFFNEVLEFLRGRHSSRAGAEQLWARLMTLSSHHIEYLKHWTEAGPMSRLRELLLRRCQGDLRLEDQQWLDAQVELPEPVVPGRASLARRLSLELAGLPKRMPLELHENLPPSLEKIVRLGRPGTLEQLVAWGAVSCSRTLAQVVPQLAEPRVDHPILKRLLQAMQAVFPASTRYHMGDLPWVGPLLSGKATLRRVLNVHLQQWPDLPLSPPLLEQLERIYHWSGIRLPESDLLRDTVYQRYYQIGGQSAPELRNCDQLLAPFAFSGLQSELPLEAMVRTAYQRICRRPRRVWRQLIFYFSFLNAGQQESFLDQTEAVDEESREMLFGLRKAL